MATTGVGPALAIEGPLPAAPAYNLTTVARELQPVLDAGGADLERWRNGIALRAYPVGTPEGFDPCATGTFREKDDGEDVVTAGFLPFVAVLSDACSAMGVGPWDEFQLRANSVLTATEAFALEAKLAKGTPIVGSPNSKWLGDTDLAVLGGGVVGPIAGLGYLENAIAATGRAGVIHATPAIAAAWSLHGYALERVGSGGGSLRTVGNWTPVIVGYGYVGTDPSSGTSPSAGKDWAFATGPVVYGRSNELIANPPSREEATDREFNDVVYRAERDLLVAWDTALQAGVLIDWTL